MKQMFIIIDYGIHCIISLPSDESWSYRIPSYQYVYNFVSGVKFSSNANNSLFALTGWLYKNSLETCFIVSV